MGSLRTTSASSIGDRTLAVVIGVGRHADTAIPALPAASTEAAAVTDALVDPQGCRLRPSSVVCLRDEQATREAICQAIEGACLLATPENTLVIYFAGHGVDVNGQFALVTFNTDRGNWEGTGVTAADLDALLGGVRARGVLLVLDCCGGAALAEGAPGFFRTAGVSADHRILLSASRAGQAAREGPSGSSFSQALIEVLAGREQLGDEMGAIYFSDLYRFLHDRATLDVEASHGSGAQEPMATASYARDPLLFLHSGLTLAQVKVLTQRRYSRRQLRAMVFRSVLGVTAAIVFGLGGLWGYVAGHHFLSVDNGVLALHRGHPSIRVLTYPRLVWQYDVRADEIVSASPLAQGLPVLSAWAQPFGEEAFGHLTAVGKARWLVNREQLKDARDQLGELIADPRQVESSAHASLLAIAIATAKEGDSLVQLAGSSRPEVRTAALSRLMHVAPERGTPIAESLGFGLGTRGVHLQVMADLPPVCSPATQRYLDGFAMGPANGQFARLQIDAALRTGCRLPDAAVVTTTEPFNQGLLARYLGVADRARAEGLQGIYLPSLMDHLSGKAGQTSLIAAAAYLAGAAPVPTCPEVSTLEHLRDLSSRLLAVRALVRICPGAALVLLPTADPREIRAELLQGAQTAARIDVGEIGTGAGLGELMMALEMLRVRGAEKSVTILERLALAHNSSSVRREAVRLLRRAGLPPKGELVSFESTGDHGLQTEAYLWHAAMKRDLVLARVRARLGDDTADFLLMLIPRLALSSKEASDLLVAAQATQVTERTRSAVTAMLADAPTAVRHLTDPSVKRRNWVSDWLAARDDLAAMARLLPERGLPGQVTAKGLELAQKQRAMLEHELRSPSSAQTADDDSWRIRLMLDLRQFSDSGVRAWLQARCKWCD